MPDNDKWKFTEPAPQSEPPEAKERKGMLFLLIAGIIIFAAGLYVSWKIGALDPEGFLGYNPYRRGYRSSQNETFILLMFNSPWLIGAAMTGAALKYFLSKRK